MSVQRRSSEMLLLVKWNQWLSQWLRLILIDTLMGSNYRYWFSLLENTRKHTERETDWERDPEHNLPEVIMWNLWLLCRAPIGLNGRLMGPPWTSWGLYCLSWTGTVWPWWTEERWLCGWRRWEVSAFLKRLWEISVRSSLKKTCLGKKEEKQHLDWHLDQQYVWSF